MNIIGAGMAGLVAGHIFRARSPVIYEAQPSLPRNHEALLRFRSDAVAKATNIAFRKATVRKAVWFEGEFHDRTTIRMANLYSLKVIGEVGDRSIWNLDTCERWTAPAVFPELLSRHLTIQYNYRVETLANLRDLSASMPVVSTMPMPVLMKIVDWPDIPPFQAKSIWSIQVQVTSPKCDIYQTLYYPGKEPYYRASLTGDRLILEYSTMPNYAHLDIETVLLHFGIIGSPEVTIMGGVKEHKIGKITPIDEDVRKDFIYTMTRDYGIYSLGRFATWRQVLLDDVVKDCRVIDSLISAEGKRRRYHQSLAIAQRENA